MEDKQSHSFVLKNEIIGSVFHEENKDMKFIEKKQILSGKIIKQVNLLKERIVLIKVVFLLQVWVILCQMLN